MCVCKRVRDRNKRRESEKEGECGREKEGEGEIERGGKERQRVVKNRHFETMCALQLKISFCQLCVFFTS